MSKALTEVELPTIPMNHGEVEFIDEVRTQGVISSYGFCCCPNAEQRFDVGVQRLTIHNDAVFYEDDLNVTPLMSAYMRAAGCFYGYCVPIQSHETTTSFGVRRSQIAVAGFTNHSVYNLKRSCCDCTACCGLLCICLACAMYRNPTLSFSTDTEGFRLLELTLITKEQTRVVRVGTTKAREAIRKIFEDKQMVR
eukprot:c4927_g1_i1.p1 GENE.c4927_g1_i1~~c4927_g1_i1.p1  ORF type:complete len:195 (+),score=21.58 c4927_g1_i1:26-610(+)